MNIKKKETNKSDSYLILSWKILFFSLAAFPLYSQKLTGALLGVWLLNSIVVAVKKKTVQEIPKERYKIFIIVCAPFIVQLIGLILSSDPSSALFSIEKSLSLLLIPIGILISSPLIYNKDVKILLVIFILSAFLLNSFVIIKGFSQGVFFRLDEASIYNPIVRNLYVKITNIHLPYLGIWFMFATLSCIHLILKGSFSRIINFLLLFAALSLTTGAFLFSARMAIIAFIITVVLYLGAFFKSIKKMSIVIFIIIAVLATLSQIPTFSYRIKEVTEGKFTTPKGKPWDPHGNQYNSVNLRVGIMVCTFEILKENWVFGVGTSEIQPLLNDCYTQFPIEGEDDYKTQKYNTHNQFAHFWLISGLFGIITFLFSLVYLLILGFRSNNFLLISFIFFTSICFLTENILERNAGVMFFAFFCSILGFKSYFKTSEENEKLN